MADNQLSIPRTPSKEQVNDRLPPCRIQPEMFSQSPVDPRKLLFHFSGDSEEEFNRRGEEFRRALGRILIEQDVAIPLEVPQMAFMGLRESSLPPGEQVAIGQQRGPIGLAGLVIELMGEIITDLTTQTVDAEVLARFAARDRRSRMLRSLSAASRAYRLGRAIFEGPQSPLRVGPAERVAVTPEQVQKAAARYLGIDDLLMVVSQ